MLSGIHTLPALSARNERAPESSLFMIQRLLKALAVLRLEDTFKRCVGDRSSQRRHAIADLQGREDSLYRRVDTVILAPPAFGWIVACVPAIFLSLAGYLRDDYGAVIELVQSSIVCSASSPPPPRFPARVVELAAACTMLLYAPWVR